MKVIFNMEDFILDSMVMDSYHSLSYKTIGQNIEIEINGIVKAEHYNRINEKFKLNELIETRYGSDINLCKIHHISVNMPYKGYVNISLSLYVR
jgi:hypothetical protein